MMKPISPAALKDVISKTIQWMRADAPASQPKEEFPASMFEELDDTIHRCVKGPESIIPVLLRGQEIFGYLPAVVQRRIARGLNVYPGEISSIVSLHSCFRTKPGGDHTVRVCLGTSCYMKGGQRVLRDIKEELKIDLGETTGDGRFTLDSVRCIGACGLAPLMQVDGNTHGPLTRGKAINSLRKYSPAN
jgi:NADP-reducing hydrogenase subunit HndA